MTENTKNTKKKENTLARIQASASILKNGRNIHGGYSFRSAEDILTALKPVLESLKCYIIADEEIVLLESRGVYSAYKKLIESDTRLFLKSTVRLYEKGTEIANAVAFAELPPTRTGMDAAQSTGASSSYAKKYALQNLFAIDNNPDPDKFHDHNDKVEDERAEKESTPREPENCKTIAELNALFSSLTEEQKKEPVVLNAFKKRKKELKGGKND